MMKRLRTRAAAQTYGWAQACLSSVSTQLGVLIARVKTSAVGGRLFRKYVGLFITVVCVALVSSGSLEIWLSFQDHKTSLVRIQHEQAEAAAAKIGQFVKEIENQIGWTTQLPWSEGTLSEREFDGQRLLRQVPAISEVRQLDSSGREQLHLSRFTMDEFASHRSYSNDPKFIEAVAHGSYYSPVYFRYESEPYISISMAGTRRENGVTLVEVNLKLIWDVVSQIRVGKRGKAYVVDAQGQLISHPDISLVLRNTNLSHLPHIQEALATEFGEPRIQIAKADSEQRALTTYASVAPLNWLVFVELPIEEAYAPLYASILRYGALVVIGLFLAGFTGLILARRMMSPIQALADGAARIGDGDLSQRIVIKTGDELESLGDQFNRMAATLQNSYSTLERKVEERTRQLQQANRAKSRFLAVASHDLRQPLHALGLFVTHLRTQLDRAERERIVDLIHSGIMEMNELFNALLDISKLEAGVLIPDLTEFPIGRLLRRIESTFSRAAAERGVELRVVPSRSWVRSDAILLERILLNLVSNAVRFSSSGVVVGCRRRGETLRIEVWDSGPGIPDSERQNIFVEFYQLIDGQHHRPGGLGLGLAIVDQLRQLLHHPIEVSSAEGKGSRFTIIVPALAAQQGEMASLSSSETVFDSVPNKLIAVIDDDVLVLEGTRALLGSWGYQVVTAGSRSEALSKITSRSQPPDLVISDYHLGQGKTGIDVIEHLRTAFAASIPAFLISGDIGSETLREARARGYQLLHKPLAPITLRLMLNRYLRKSSSTAGATETRFILS